MDLDIQGHIESIAASIFSRQGVDFAAVQRAGGWTNAVWMSKELVLRLSTKKENGNLLREARLSMFLPQGVGYPRIVETGNDSGYAWMLREKLPGKSLGEAWDELSWSERVTTLQSLWKRAEHVHTVRCEYVADIVPGRAWFNSNNPKEAEASLEWLTRDRIFSEKESRALLDALARFWEALPGAPCVLCHGDLTMDNAVWYEGQVIAILDFEFAVRAPVQLDLNHLVKCAYGPDNDLYSPGSQQLRLAVKELAMPYLVQPGSRALFMGYAILLELWLLELWLAHPEGEGPLEQWEPLRRLRSLADGGSGYLRPLVG